MIDLISRIFLLGWKGNTERKCVFSIAMTRTWMDGCGWCRYLHLDKRILSYIVSSPCPKKEAFLCVLLPGRLTFGFGGWKHDLGFVKTFVLDEFLFKLQKLAILIDFMVINCRFNQTDLKVDFIICYSNLFANSFTYIEIIRSFCSPEASISEQQKIIEINSTPTHEKKR